jgi:phospholipid transport system substrate-binding protein
MFKFIILSCAFLFSQEVLSKVPASASASPKKEGENLYIKSTGDFFNDLIELSKLSKESQAAHTNETNVLIRRASDRVDFTVLSQKSLGAQWNKLSANQRKDFLATLQSLLEEVAYPQAHRLVLNQEGFEFEYIEHKVEPKIKIRGVIERKKRGEIVLEAVEIQLIYNAKSKKIVDAILEGELLTQNLKRQFDEALKKRSFAEILDLMKKRVAKAKEDKQESSAAKEKTKTNSTKSVEASGEKSHENKETIPKSSAVSSKTAVKIR